MTKSAFFESCLLGSVINHISVSGDNKRIAGCSGHQCQVFNTKDAKKEVRTLALRHDSPLVASFFIESSKLVTVTQNGDVAEWAFDDDGKTTMISTKKVTAFPVSSAYICHREGRQVQNELWLVVQRGAGDAASNMADLCYVCPDNSVEKVVQVPADIKSDQICISGEMLAYCYGNEVHARSVDPEDNKETVFTYESKSEKIGMGDGAEQNEFVRIAAVGNYLAANMANGRIYLWSNLQKSGVSDGAYTFHWHKVAPQLELTPFGNVISAGAECTMVRSTKGGESTFLPRLAAPVAKLRASPDSTRVVLLLEDNSLHVVLLASMAIETSLPTLNYCERSLNTIFISDPGATKMFVMNAKPGCIQWVNPTLARSKRVTNITLENVVDGDMSLVGVQLGYKDVLAVAFAMHHVASIEAFVNFEAKNQLRFWNRNVFVSAYELQLVHTVAVPIDCCFVSCCAKEGLYDRTVVTASKNGRICVYEFAQNGQNVVQDVTRSCDWQESGITAVANIQADGKWASAHDRHVVLWDVAKMKFLEATSCESRILSLSFSPDGRYLIVATELDVFGWNALSLAVEWRVQQKVGIAVGFESDGCFAYFGSQVMQFESSTGRVMNTFKFSANIDDLCVVNKANPIAIAKTSQGILAIHQAKPPSTSTSTVATAKAPSTTSAKTTPFQRQGVQRPTDSPLGDTPIVVQPKPDATKIFAGPCHSLPPLTLLAPLFLEKALIPRECS